MRRKLLKMSGWLAFGVWIANLIPLFYGLIFPPQPLFGRTLYVRSLLVLFPLITTYGAVRRTKTLWGYLIWCAVIMAAVGVAAWFVGPALGKDGRLWAYVVILLLETFLIMLNRFSVRLRRQEEYEAMLAKEGENATYNEFLQGEHRMLDRPHKQFLVIFLITYAAGWLLYNRALCDVALFSGGCYLILFCFYVYLEKTEEYLSVNQRVAGVPRKRIYGIGRTMFLVFTAMLLIAMLPGILTVNRRSYQDLRSWTDNWERGTEVDFDEETAAGDSEIDFEVGYGYRTNEPPKWLNGLFYVVGTGCFALIMYFIVQTVRQVLVDFRADRDENGDIIENLEAEQEEEITRIAGRRTRQDREKESVRRKYRRTIRRYRKDAPDAAETPYEIEEKAGLADNEDMKALHAQYERERYGDRMKQ